MRFALDTNRYTDFRRGLPEVVRMFHEADVIYMPLPTLVELRVGFAGGRRGADNERAMREFLSRSGVSVLCPDELTGSYYVAIYHQLRQQGTPIPTNDMWIAALVLQHGTPLFTRDGHFEHLPQIAKV